VVVALFFFVAFISAVRNGQFDDSYTPAVRMLFEDELITEKKKSSKKSNQTDIKST
jgi:cbb3-type cytochrome oxidase maturation protein